MSKKVLIVEDDANIAELLHLYLEKEGFETQVAKDGGKGVELFRSFQPDLVLLDLMLPIMDGWSVLKRSGSRTRLRSSCSQLRARQRIRCPAWSRAPMTTSSSPSR